MVRSVRTPDEWHDVGAYSMGNGTVSNDDFIDTEGLNIHNGEGGKHSKRKKGIKMPMIELPPPVLEEPQGGFDLL